MSDKIKQMNQHEKLMKLTMATLRVDNPDDFRKIVEKLDMMKSAQFASIIYEKADGEVAAYQVRLNASYENAVRRDLETVRETKIEANNFKEITEGVFDVLTLRKARMEIIYSLQNSLATIKVKQFLSRFNLTESLIEQIKRFEVGYDIFAEQYVVDGLKKDNFTKKMIRENLLKLLVRGKESIGLSVSKTDEKARLDNKIHITGGLTYNASATSQHFLLECFVENKKQIKEADALKKKKDPISKPFTIAKGVLKKELRTTKYASFILSADSIEQISISGDKLKFESKNATSNLVMDTL